MQPYLKGLLLMNACSVLPWKFMAVLCCVHVCPARYHNNSTMWHLIASLSPPPFSTPPPPVSTHLLSQQLNLSYNRLQVLNLQNLCLPNLEKLNVSHNKIPHYTRQQKGRGHPPITSCMCDLSLPVVTVFGANHTSKFVTQPVTLHGWDLELLWVCAFLISPSTYSP